jgi:hypothetical protein
VDRAALQGGATGVQDVGGQRRPDRRKKLPELDCLTEIDSAIGRLTRTNTVTTLTVLGTAVEKIRARHAPLIEGVRFAVDSPLEGAVSSEPVSEAKFPVTRQNTGNFIDSGFGDG